MPDWTRLPDLAGRALGGAVVCANDEFFAAKENLVKPEPAVARAEFGHKGKEYDGWETRRRRTAGHDWAVVRLGVPGVVRRTWLRGREADGSPLGRLLERGRMAG